MGQQDNMEFGVEMFSGLFMLKLAHENLCAINISFLKKIDSFLQCPPILEEHESLRSHDGAVSALTAEFLVDLGLDASTPDTYRAPPAPLPYDLVLGYPQSTESESARETVSGGSFETLTTCEDLEESDCKAQANSLCVSPRKLEAPNFNEPNVSVAKEEDICPNVSVAEENACPNVSVTEEEDVCPICLEGALPENWCFFSLFKLFPVCLFWEVKSRIF